MISVPAPEIFDWHGKCGHHGRLAGAGAVEIIENIGMARIQMILSAKPDDATRRALRAKGFRWSPWQGAWQRHLNEARRWVAERVMKAITTEDAA